ncbi:MAG: FUSC family protein [Firmicutes bacterium]|nr:FUSC family protein [Bacillota bacterium]
MSGRPTNPRGMGALTFAVRRLLQELIAYDARLLAWPAGLRAATGVVIPLALGYAAGDPVSGVVAAVGALVVGYAGLSGAWRTRLRTVGWASLWVAVAALAGAWVGRSLWVTVTAVAGSGALATLLGAISPEFAQVGTLATNVLIVFSGLGLAPSTAAASALWVLAGGGIQWVLLWSWGRWQLVDAGRRSLLAAWDALVDFCRRPDRAHDLAVARALTVAEGRVEDPALAPEPRRRLARLLNLVDLLRNDIVAMRLGAPAASSRAWLDPLADLLRRYRQALSRTQMPWSRAATEVAELRAGRQALLPRLPDSGLGEHLGELLQAVEEILAGTWPASPAESPPRRSAPSPAKPWWPAVQAALWRSSPTRRQMLRVALTLAAAELIAHLLRLPRGYWVALTAAVVLRPDFFSTFGRGVARAAGTVIGVLLGSLWLMVGRDHPLLTLAPLGVAAWMAYSVLTFNYGVFSVMLSAEIVMLLSVFEGVSPKAAISERVVATVVGSLVALAIYALYPTWQRRRLTEELARLVVADRQYFHAIVSGEPATPWRRQTRLARVEVAALVETALAEPAPIPLSRPAVLRLLEGLHRLTQQLMALEAALGAAVGPPPGGLLSYAEAYGARLLWLSEALKAAGQNPAHTPLAPPPPSLEAISDPTLRQLALRLNAIFTQLAAAFPLSEAHLDPPAMPASP